MKYIYMVNRFQFGDQCEKIAGRLQSACRKFHRDYEIRINKRPESVRNYLKECRDRECVISCLGGDGSINLLLNELVNSSCILSFVPVGTGNDFYRTCCETLQPGIRDLDMIRINDRYFINTCCFGIDADIACDDHFIHNSFIPRPLRYHAGVLYHFFAYEGGRHMKVLCDGEIIEKDYMTIVAACGRYYGGGYRVSPDSLLDDGIMEVYLVDKVSKIKMASMILSMKDGGHLKEPALRMIRTKKLEIITDHPIRANIDGEPIQSDHFQLEMIPKGIRVDFDPEFIQYLSFY